MRRPENRWNVAPIPPAALDEEIPALARTLGVPALVARLLWLRELRSLEPARAFLQPCLADLSPPSILPDVDRAADRIARAVRDGERIGVYGDYDVDGMTGTALLVRFLRDLAGGDAIWAIPSRDGEGYGLTPSAVNRFASRGARMLVTVDNGIVAHEAVERANALGMDVVITDHHLPADTLPSAYAVVDPHRRDAGDEGLDLCGCALAFKIAWAIADRLRNVAGRNAARFREFLRDAVGLVALATVSDVVPLRNENRILVSQGLHALRASSHLGIQALLETSRLPALPLTTTDVAFRIAPRLNAAGRLSRPELVVDLLTATEADAARRLARMLTDANVERRRIEKRVLEAAEQQAEGVLSNRERHSLVVHGEGWHPGVVGIVAARLVDRHHRPAVVIGFDGKDGRGSCRTPSHVNLHTALANCNTHLGRFGGHAAAAGLEIERSNVEHFADAFEEAVRAQTHGEPPLRTIEIDAVASADDWDLDTVESIRRLAPFGAGNPEPLFLVPGAGVAGRARLMGQNDAHLSFSIKRTGGAVRVVGFHQAAHFELTRARRPLDLVVAPMVNEWKGVRTAELRLVDMRESAESA